MGTSSDEQVRASANYSDASRAASITRPGADRDRYLICFDGDADPVLVLSLAEAARHVRGFDRHDFRGFESVIAFNPVEGWSRDVTEDVARSVYSAIGDDVRPALLDWLDSYLNISVCDEARWRRLCGQ